MANQLESDKQYRQWLSNIKQRVRQSQIKATIAVNSSLIEFYWSLGADIVQKQKKSTWGSGFLQQLSKDLMSEFPDMKRFSYRNLKYIRQWYLFYSQDDIIAKQAAAQLCRIPWWHNIVIIQKCTTTEQAMFYVNQTIEQIEAEHCKTDYTE